MSTSAPAPRQPGRARRAWTGLRRAALVGSGWPSAIGVALLALAMRLWRLGYPREFLFDETYYAKDGWSLWEHGYVREFVDGANERILAGDLDVFRETPSMTVHPEVGKWLIGLGQEAFGVTPFGWRVASAVAGALLVLVLIRLTRRLTGSTLLGLTAGVLLMVDGLHFVMSRLALLDIFLALFLLAGVSCLVVDRDRARSRMARLVPLDRLVEHGWGPVRPLLVRPWRIAAGVLFGLAVGCKWTALFPLAAFGLLAWAWDAGLRREIGVRYAVLRSAIVDGLPAFVSLVGVAFVVYVATWTGWLVHAEAYEQHLSDTQYGAAWGDYTEEEPGSVIGEATQSLRSLAYYHRDVFTFHTKFLNDSEHTYQSDPRGWLLLNRPVGVDAQLDIAPGEQGCTAVEGSDCLRQIILLGTPLLWWGGVVALAYAVIAWLGRRDWRYGVAVVGVASSWLPWFRYDDRPIFLFYATAFLPFTVLAATLLLGRVLGPPDASPRRRRTGAVAAGTFVVLVALNFAWFWPVYTDGLLTTAQWLQRIWFSQWI